MIWSLPDTVTIFIVSFQILSTGQRNQECHYSLTDKFLSVMDNQDNSYSAYCSSCIVHPKRMSTEFEVVQEQNVSYFLIFYYVLDGKGLLHMLG